MLKVFQFSARNLFFLHPRWISFQFVLFLPLFLSFSRPSVGFSVHCHCRICALFHVINISDTLYVICASEMPLIFAIPFPVRSNTRKKETTLEYENCVGLSFSRYDSVFFCRSIHNMLIDMCRNWWSTAASMRTDFVWRAFLTNM